MDQFFLGLIPMEANSWGCFFETFFFHLKKGRPAARPRFSWQDFDHFSPVFGFSVFFFPLEKPREKQDDQPPPAAGEKGLLLAAF